ncbi:hypothetical protein BD779DRAFT_162424 [Infundibulicybe gibba]|nr:hypothetical protein BD779DRAFT_162424 [Infundibulicybe gibba]
MTPAQAPTSRGDRIRIAIALAALQFKPPDQSFAFCMQSTLAYVLDLRATFPPSVPAAPSADGSWRTHALALERDYAELEAKYEAAQIQNITASMGSNSGSAPPAPSSSSEQPASVTDSTKRKKKKKRPAEPEPQMDPAPHTSTGTHIFGESRSRARVGPIGLATTGADIPRISGPASLVGALDAFSHLHTRGQVPPALVLSATLRAMDAISRVLCEALEKPRPTQADAALLNNLGSCASGVLSVALPLLAPAPTTGPYEVDGGTALDTLITRVFAGLLHPLIHSFALLSQTHASALLLAPSQKPKIPPVHTLPEADTPDLRPHALSLFSTLLCVLAPEPPQRENPIPAGLQGRAHDLCATLALYTLRALAQVYEDPTLFNSPWSSPAPTPNLMSHPTLSQVETVPGGGGATRVAFPSTGPPGARSDVAFSLTVVGGLRTARPERVARLARKEAMWYLCQILHVLFSGAPEPMPPHQSQGVHDAILGALLGVLQCTPDTPVRRDDASGVNPSAHHEWDIGEQGRRQGPGDGSTVGESGAVGDVQGSGSGPRRLGEAEEGVGRCAHGGGALSAGGKGGEDMEGRQVESQAPRREMTDMILFCGAGSDLTAWADCGAGEMARGMLLGVVERYWHWRGGNSRAGAI